MIQTVVISGASRSARMVFIADGAAWLSVNLADPTLVTGAGSIVGPSEIPQLCQVSGSGTIYITTRGSAIKQINASTGATVTFTATNGSTLPSGPALCCIYRDRLVVAGVSGDEQNVFASRSGTHTDFQYADTDPAAAWAGNSGTAGKISDIITALIPVNDDYLILGGDHTIFRIQGDPGYGGSIGKISDKVGIIGPEAWTTDTQGVLYFVGQDGFYRMTPDGTITNLSALRLTDWFKSVDRNAYYVVVRWDEQSHGCWIFCTCHSDTAASYHLFWDARTDGFFPVSLPHSFGPVSAMVWDADQPSDAALLLGSRNNLVQKYDPESLTDDDQPISSYVYVGPFRLAGEQREAKFIALQQILGELRSPHEATDFNLAYSVQVGQDAYEAFNSPTGTATGTLTAGGSQSPIGLRLSGNAAYVRYSNTVEDTTWSLDRTSMVVAPAGRDR